MSAIRSAEKERTSSCEFADAVANATIQVYRHTIPESLKGKFKQVCYALE